MEDPQFECGKEIADNYKGVITNKRVHEDVINKIIKAFNEKNYFCTNLTFSPVTGGSGNIEYLGYFIRENKKNHININKVINEAYKKLKTRKN